MSETRNPEELSLRLARTLNDLAAIGDTFEAPPPITTEGEDWRVTVPVSDRIKRMLMLRKRYIDELRSVQTQMQNLLPATSRKRPEAVSEFEALKATFIDLDLQHKFLCMLFETELRLDFPDMQEASCLRFDPEWRMHYKPIPGAPPPTLVIVDLRSETADRPHGLH
ncbi:MAG TPA: hypothetical protein VNU47_02985 [Candidatus Paceibacterota bacterium]|nr:hypothetical protein [Candidatus Paceibacterota bacterium]